MVLDLKEKIQECCDNYKIKKINFLFEKNNSDKTKTDVNKLIIKDLFETKCNVYVKSSKSEKNILKLKIKYLDFNFKIKFKFNFKFKDNDYLIMDNKKIIVYRKKIYKYYSAPLNKYVWHYKNKYKEKNICKICNLFNFKICSYNYHKLKDFCISNDNFINYLKKNNLLIKYDKIFLDYFYENLKKFNETTTYEDQKIIFDQMKSMYDEKKYVFYLKKTFDERNDFYVPEVCYYNYKKEKFYSNIMEFFTLKF